MQKELFLRNIVLVGLFNPSLFDKYFFIKNGILKEEDLVNKSAFILTQGSQIVSANFQILVSLNQIIITSINATNNDEIEAVASKIINSGEMTVITGVGINFHWGISDNTKSLSELSKELFYNERSHLNNFFDGDNPMYGAYFSKNVKDARLKLDIKPVLFEQISDKKTIKDTLYFSFNFHFDVKPTSFKSEALEYISDYKFYKEKSENVIAIYE